MCVYVGVNVGSVCRDQKKLDLQLLVPSHNHFHQSNLWLSHKHTHKHNCRQRERARLAELQTYFGGLQQLVSAVRHSRSTLLANSFHEWRNLGVLKMELYKKVCCMFTCLYVRVHSYIIYHITSSLHYYKNGTCAFQLISITPTSHPALVPNLTTPYSYTHSLSCA